MRSERFGWALLAGALARAAAATDAGVSAEEEAALIRALEQDAAPATSAPPAPSPVDGVVKAIQSLNPDLSFIADVALAAFSDRDHLQTGGHDPTANGFNLQQLELAVGAAVDPYFRFDANLVFAQEGVEIEEVYATTLALPHGLQGRVGQFLTRFGRQNATHPHTWAFVDQHLALGRIFGAEGNRGLGVELAWLTPLPWFAEASVSVTDAAGEATARSFFGAQNLGVTSPLHLQTTGKLNQFFDLGDAVSLLWGLSAATGPNPTGRGNRTDVYGTDLYLKYRPALGGDPTTVVLQTEWFYRRRQIPRELLHDVSGYALASWRFAPRWAVAARYDYGAPALLDSGERALARDALDPEWSSSRHRASASLTFWPTEFSRARLQGSVDLPGWRPPLYAVFVAMEFSVGAHAAHSF